MCRRGSRWVNVRCMETSEDERFTIGMLLGAVHCRVRSMPTGFNLVTRVSGE